jgi:hypothetical protein
MFYVYIFHHVMLYLEPPEDQNNFEYKLPYRKYAYFDVVMGFAWSNDHESYAGGGVATGWASHADRSKVMTQTKIDTLVLQVGGWAWG